MITFDDEKHAYYVNGERVLSVTQIIGEWVLVNGYYVNIFDRTQVKREAFEDGADAGTAVHRMVSYYLDGTLDTDALPDDLTAVLATFMDWESYVRPDILSYEQYLYSKKYHYCGTYDIEAVIGGKHAVIDIKSGIVGLSGVQLAAYAELLRENNGTRRKYDRYTLQLPRDGSAYKFMPHTDPADWDFFRCRLSQFNYLKRR